MEKKEFRFQGLDAETELRISLLLIIPSVIIMIVILYFSHVIFPGIFFLIPLILAAILTVSVSIILLRHLTKRINDKEWTIKVDNGQNVFIKFRNKEYNFGLKDILMIKNMGNVNIRYLTLKTNRDTIKIRVGNTGFAPFSTPEDIHELDSFVEFLKPYIEKNFNKKILKNAANPNIIPNFGVYIEKQQKIRYSLINKLKPWQIATLIVGTLMLIMFTLMKVLFYYFDNH